MAVSAGLSFRFGPTWVYGLDFGAQGLAMLDPARPFIESVRVTIPYLEWRSVGGSLMVASHVVFVLHFLAMVLHMGPNRVGAALFSTQAQAMEAVNGK